MSRILIGCIPAWGHFNPTVAIAQRLQKMGHEVGYACHPGLKGAAEKAGIPMLEDFKWGDLIWDCQKLSGENKKAKAIWKIIKATKGQYHKLFLDKLPEGTANLISLVEKWQPDVCLFDTMFYPGPIAAAKKGIPYAHSCSHVLNLPSKELPRFGPGYPPRKNVFSTKEKLKIKIYNDIKKSYDKEINRVIKNNNIAPVIGGTFISDVSPYLYMAYTTEAFEYPRKDLIPQAFFVGPSVTTNRGDREDTFPWEWVKEGPVVYVSMGTIITKRKVFNRFIDAAREVSWKMVLSIGRYLDVNEWQDLPENILLQNHVPQPELLKKVDAVVCHGGNNTVTEALKCGVPLAVLSQRADQHEAAQRVVEAGAGLRLNYKSYTVELLRNTIEELLSNSNIRKNAKKIADDYSRCDGPGAAASLLLKLAKTRRPLHRPPGTGPNVYSHNLEEILAAI